MKPDISRNSRLSATANAVAGMTAVGVIPARWGSTRFPGKSIALIGGKPMICRVAERALRATRLRRVIVATDDARIADAVRPLGISATMTAPDHASGTDRIAEALRGVAADIVVNIQGDEPLIEPDLIDRLVDALAGGEWDMATAAAPLEDDAAVHDASAVKVVWDRSGRALYFSRSVIPHLRDPGLTEPCLKKGLYWRHVGIYAYTRPFLDGFVATPPCATELAEKLEQLRALHMGGRIRVLKTDEWVTGGDNPEDVRRVEEIIRRRGLDSGPRK